MYKINDACVGCETCMGECPLGAISKDEPNGVCVIDSDKCANCGTCASICPMGAIVEE